LYEKPAIAAMQRTPHPSNNKTTTPKEMKISIIRPSPPIKTNFKLSFTTVGHSLIIT
jgi:hypothetical protein